MTRTVHETPAGSGTQSGEPHPFDLATALVAHDDGVWRGRAAPRYSNRVGTFGGFVSAALLKSVMLHPARLGEPIALTVNFCGPMTDGEFLVAARAVRTNRSTQHWLIELAQDVQIVASATAVTALRRETWSSTEARFPQVPPMDALTRMPPVPGSTWTASYDLRFVRGAHAHGARLDAPWDSVSTLWIRDDPPRPLDFVALASICDAFFPRIYVRRPDLTPLGTTVSLTTYFHVDAAMLAAHGDREVLGTARALQFRNGYCDQTGEIWTPDGALIAATHQTAYFRE